MVRKNFHRIANPRAAVLSFLKTEAEKGNKVYWDRGHIPVPGGGDTHNNPGVGIYCCSVRPRDDYDQHYAINTQNFMLLKTESDVDEMFTYFEDNE